MDVGNRDFRFQYAPPVDGGYATKEARTYREPACAELHINTLDRYTSTNAWYGFTQAAGKNQPISQLSGQMNSAQSGFESFGNTGSSSGTNCNISSNENLIDGYFKRLAVTEFQLQYCVPTVMTGYNDYFYLLVYTSFYQVVRVGPIAQGFYTQATLATAYQTAMQTAITAVSPGSTCSFVTSSTGFLFTMGGTPITAQPYAFQTTIAGQPTAQSDLIVHWSACRMLGMNRACYGFTNLQTPPGDPNAFTGISTWTTSSCNLMPTDYIDVVSSTLTRFKKAKDTNTTDAAPQNVLMRIYFPQDNNTIVPGSNAPTSGSYNFFYVKQYAHPNWCEWSAASDIFNIDIKLLDMWGNQLFWSAEYPTELAFTLLLSES